MTQLSIMQVSFEELCLSVDISEALMFELVEYKIVNPAIGLHRDEWLFDARAASMVRKAIRLQRDLVIDMADLALVLNLLDENEQLQEENARLRQRLNRFQKMDNED